MNGESHLSKHNYLSEQAGKNLSISLQKSRKPFGAVVSPCQRGQVTLEQAAFYDMSQNISGTQQAMFHFVT